MMYPYMTLGDGTEIVHSNMKHEDGVDKVCVHFERPTENGFDSARCELPSCIWAPWEGRFSEDEIAFFTELLEHNAHLIYRYAKDRGLKIG